MTSYRPEKDMPSRNPQEYLVETPTNTTTGTPDTHLQALMETAPHQEPQLSAEELAQLPTPALDAMDQLDPYHRALIDMYVFKRMSYEQIAVELEMDWRMQAKREVDMALKTLELLLLEVTQDDLGLAS